MIERCVNILNRIRGIKKPTHEIQKIGIRPPVEEVIVKYLHGKATYEEYQEVYRNELMGNNPQVRTQRK